MLDLLTASQLSKSLDAFSSQLDPQSIVMFFKCMDASCDFCTDEEDKFKNHLVDHINPENQCCYCDTVASTEAEVVKHMVAVHGSCKFQCAMCFYRSQTLTHIRVHSLLKHQSRTVLWYLCSERVALDTKLDSCNKDHIGSYVCMGDCNFKTLCAERFIQHLSIAHEGSCNFSCHICFEKVCSPDAIVNHYTETHGFCAFHCFYCSFGSHIDWDVVTHLTSCHSDKPFRIFCRGEEIPKSFVTLKELQNSNLHGGISPSSTCLPPAQSPKNEQEESTMHKKPSLHVEVKMEMPVENCMPIKDVDVKENVLAPVPESSEVRCKCGAVFSNVAMFLQHIGERHSRDSGFDCPMCAKFANCSVIDLFVHVADCHTAFSRCIYKNCFFLATSQESIDSHIMQVHQHYDLCLENASAADHEGTCSAADAMETETDKHCCDDNVDESNNAATTGEESSFKEEDELLCDAKVMHICDRCNHADMQPLDYFRHMTLGHGVKYFCGHCEKCYKQKKQMILHHKRCHSILKLLVRSFEDNKLKDITRQIQLDQQDEVQDKAEMKSVDMATSKPIPKVESYGSHITSLSTPLHHSHIKEKALPIPSANGGDQNAHCKRKSYIERFGNLEPVPLGKKHIYGNKKRHQDYPHYLGTAQQACKPSDTKQLSQASTQSTVNYVQHPLGNRSGIELPGGRKLSRHSRPAGLHGKPLKGDDKVPQPTNDSKPSYYCGHCMKGYKLLKALITHQKSIHPELPMAVKRLDMSKLDDVTYDLMEGTCKDVHAAAGAKPDSSVPAQQNTSSGSSEASDNSNDGISSCSDIGIPPTHTWRRIKFMDSESENESHDSDRCTREGFSYYGKPVEPMDYSNLYVRIKDGDLRIAYRQFARVLNFHPIVLVHKDTSYVTQMCTK